MSTNNQPRGAQPVVACTPSAREANTARADEEEAQASASCLACRALFSQNAKVKHQAHWRRRLANALRSGNAAEVSAWVQHHNGVLGARDPGPLTDALWVALKSGNLEIVKILAKGGADISGPCPTSFAAAQPDASARRPPAARAPLCTNLTPLMYSASRGNHSIVSYLVEAGANPAVAAVASSTGDTSHAGWLALHFAIVATKGQGSSVGTLARALPGVMLFTHRTADGHEDFPLRFAVRHDAPLAVQTLLTLGALPSLGDGEASCPFLAGQLGTTLDVWDMTPPPPSVPPERDGFRDTWKVSTAEKRMQQNRLEVLQGAASLGRLDVLERILNKPDMPFYCTLQEHELAMAIAACRSGAPPNAAQVQAFLTSRKHTPVPWQHVQKAVAVDLDTAAVQDWVAKDRPRPSEVDAALAYLMEASPHLVGAASAPGADAAKLRASHAAAADMVRALVDAGASVNIDWADTQSSAGLQHWPLERAAVAGAEPVVKALIAAGANIHHCSTGSQESVLMAALRAACAVDNTPPASPAQASEQGAQPAVAQVSSSEALHWWMEVCTTLLEAGLAATLNTVINSIGLTAAYLAAVLDLPNMLSLLVQHGADPWAVSPPPPPGVPANKDVLQALHGTAAPHSVPTQQWTVVHETARTGALHSLKALVGLVESKAAARQASPSPEPQPQRTLASVERDALVGSLCGGCLPAAQLGLDRCRLGLYPEEMAAALELCRAGSESSTPGAPSLATRLGPQAVFSGPTLHAAPTGAYKAVATYIRSRPHIYLDWDTQVLPALHAADLTAVVAWIADDRVGVPHDKVAGPLATRALHALVTGPAVVNSHTSGSCPSPPYHSPKSLSSRYASAGSNAADEEAQQQFSTPRETTPVAKHQPTVSVAKALLAAGADPHHTWDTKLPAVTGFSLLMQVAAHGCDPMVQTLLAAGARLADEDSTGYTALDHAALSGQLTAAQRLLDAGAQASLNTHRTREGLTTLAIAIRAGHAHVVRLLLGAGADPALAALYSSENALFFLLRTAAAKDHPAPVGANKAGAGATAQANELYGPYTDMCIMLLNAGLAATLNTVVNSIGLTAAYLAAALDLPHLLGLLVQHGADPWALSPPAPAGVPASKEVLQALHGTAALDSNPVERWTVVHETARTGALRGLQALLTLHETRLKQQAEQQAEVKRTLASVERDALVGSLCGGCLPAAQLGLDRCRLGLYPEEMAAALELCRASEAAWPGPPPLAASTDEAAALVLVATSQAPVVGAYQEVAAYVRSRPHIYLDWESQVLPALHAADLGAVVAWIADDRVGVAHDKVAGPLATKALHALVTGPAIDVSASSLTDPTTPSTTATPVASVYIGPGSVASDKGEPPALHSASGGLSSPGVARTHQTAVAITQALLQAGGDPHYAWELDAAGTTGYTLLMQVAACGCDPMVQTLLAAGARLADEDSTGYTALDHAVLHGQQAAAQCLLEAGAKASLNSHRTREGLTCLAIAILAGHAHIVRLLLGAGADPSLAALHSSENALFFLIRTAAAKYQLQTAAKSGEVFDPYMEMCTMLLSAGLASFLNSVTNSAGLTAAYLAATLDLPQILGLLVQHGADPWALSPPAPAGVPANKEVLQALHGTAAPGSAPVESWTVVHEAARTGAVRSLETLLALREQQRQQQQQKEEDPFKRHTCASVERDALVGSLCGGCLPAAQLGLDRCRLGLYPEEMTAALELCRASEAAWPGPPSLAAVVDGVTASPLAPQQTQLTGTFESVASYVQSRPHIYLNWETQVLPALHSADLVSVVAWITDDRVGVPHDKVAGPLATKALHALVTGPAMGAHQSETVVLITQALLQARADPHFAWSLEGTGMQGFTLLMQAAVCGCEPLVQTLLDARARLEDEDSAGYTALDHAALHGRLAAAQCLLEAGAKSSLNTHRTREGLTTLAIAVRAGHASLVRLLLASGADPAVEACLNGENALFFLLRTAAAKGPAAAPVQPSEASSSTGAGSAEPSPPSTPSTPIKVSSAYAEMCAMLLQSGLSGSINSVINTAGLTAAYLAAALDLPQLLRLLVQHGADPWAVSPPPPPGVPANKDVLQALHGTAAPHSMPLRRWTVVHETARTGALRSLQELLNLLETGVVRQSQSQQRTLTGFERDALVGSLCGGCLPAAQLGLDRCRLGLYPEEMAAALELCRASEAAWPGPPPLAASQTGQAAYPSAGIPTAAPLGIFEAVASYIRSRPHIYLDWDTQVLPALHAADRGAIMSWIKDDRVGVRHDHVAGPLATKALHALVTGPATAGSGARKTSAAADKAANLHHAERGSLSPLHVENKGPGPLHGKTGQPVLIASALLRAGAEPYYAWTLQEGGVQGFTLLMQAALRGHEGLLALLLTAGADPWAQDSLGFTPLFYAITGCHLDCARALLASAPDPPEGRAVALNTMCTVNGGYNALGLAVRSGSLEMVQLLMGAGADPLAPGPKHPQCPVFIAAYLGLLPILAALTAGSEAACRPALLSGAAAGGHALVLEQALMLANEVPLVVATRQKQATSGGFGSSLAPAMVMVDMALTALDSLQSDLEPLQAACHAMMRVSSSQPASPATSAPSTPRYRPPGAPADAPAVLVPVKEREPSLSDNLRMPGGVVLPTLGEEGGPVTRGTSEDGSFTSPDAVPVSFFSFPKILSPKTAAGSSESQAGPSEQAAAGKGASHSRYAHSGSPASTAPTSPVASRGTSQAQSPRTSMPSTPVKAGKPPLPPSSSFSARSGSVPWQRAPLTARHLGLKLKALQLLRTLLISLEARYSEAVAGVQRLEARFMVEEVKREEQTNARLASISARQSEKERAINEWFTARSQQLEACLKQELAKVDRQESELLTKLQATRETRLKELEALHAQDIEAAAKAVEARRAELATSMKAVEAQFKTAREQLASSPISEAEKAKRLEQLQDKEDEVYSLAKQLEVYLESATETEVPALYRRQKADLLDTAAKEEQRIKACATRERAHIQKWADRRAVRADHVAWKRRTRLNKWASTQTAATQRSAQTEKEARAADKKHRLQVAEEALSKMEAEAQKVAAAVMRCHAAATLELLKTWNAHAGHASLPESSKQGAVGTESWQGACEAEVAWHQRLDLPVQEDWAVYDNAWGKHLKPGVLDSLGVLGRKHEQAAAAAAAGRTENGDYCRQMEEMLVAVTELQQAQLHSVDHMLQRCWQGTGAGSPRVSAAGCASPDSQAGSSHASHATADLPDLGSLSELEERLEFERLGFSGAKDAPGSLVLGGATDWSGCWDFLPAGSTKSFYDSADEGPGLGAESGMASATTVDYQNSGSDASDAGSGDEGQEENMGSLATLDMPGDGPVKLADGLAGFVLSGLDIRTSAMQADRAKSMDQSSLELGRLNSLIGRLHLSSITDPLTTTSQSLSVASSSDSPAVLVPVVPGHAGGTSSSTSGQLQKLVLKGWNQLQGGTSSQPQQHIPSGGTGAGGGGMSRAGSGSLTSSAPQRAGSVGGGIPAWAAVQAVASRANNIFTSSQKQGPGRSGSPPKSAAVPPVPGRFSSPPKAGAATGRSVSPHRPAAPPGGGGGGLLTRAASPSRAAGLFVRASSPARGGVPRGTTSCVNFQIPEEEGELSVHTSGAGGSRGGPATTTTGPRTAWGTSVTGVVVTTVGTPSHTSTTTAGIPARFPSASGAAERLPAVGVPVGHTQQQASSAATTQRQATVIHLPTGKETSTSWVTAQRSGPHSSPEVSPLRGTQVGGTWASTRQALRPPAIIPPPAPSQPVTPETSPSVPAIAASPGSSGALHIGGSGSAAASPRSPGGQLTVMHPGAWPRPRPTSPATQRPPSLDSLGGALASVRKSLERSGVLSPQKARVEPVIVTQPGLTKSSSSATLLQQAAAASQHGTKAASVPQIQIAVHAGHSPLVPPAGTESIRAQHVSPAVPGVYAQVVSPAASASSPAASSRPSGSQVATAPATPAAGMSPSGARAGGSAVPPMAVVAASPSGKTSGGEQPQPWLHAFGMNRAIWKPGPQSLNE